MFANLVSDSLKHKKTVEGYLSKEIYHEVKTSAIQDIQKQKSAIFIDCLLSGCVQSYCDLFFVDKNSDTAASELETLSTILCESELMRIDQNVAQSMVGYERVLSAYWEYPKFGACTHYFCDRFLGAATEFGLTDHITRGQFNLGRFHEKSANLEEALHWLTLCASLPEASEKYIEVCWRIGQASPAASAGIPYYRKALDCAALSQSTRTAEAMNKLGVNLLAAGATDDAIEHHNQELTICVAAADLGGELRARSSLAQALEISGDTAAAIEQLSALLDKAVSASPRDLMVESLAKQRLGLIYLDQFMDSQDKETGVKAIALLQEYFELEVARCASEDCLDEARIILGLARSTVFFPDYLEASKDVSKMLRWKASASLSLN
jgi:tetratricopeptide (TPR) repeat protein